MLLIAEGSIPKRKQSIVIAFSVYEKNIGH